jgi:hypothetical protein
MGTRATGKKCLLRKVLQNRIKFFESLMHRFWGSAGRCKLLCNYILYVPGAADAH